MDTDPLLRLLEGLDPTPHLLARPLPHPEVAHQPNLDAAIAQLAADLAAAASPPPPAEVRPDPELVRLLDPKSPPPDSPLLRDWPSS